MFEPNAFEFPPSGVFLTLQHQRSAPLAKYPDGGMALTESADALTLRARIGDTTLGKDTLTNIRNKVLTGLSIEFVALEERSENSTRIVSKALLRAISVVDVAAYPESTVQARAAELRQDGNMLIATFPFNQSLTTRDRGIVRKNSWNPDSFKFALEDINREISICLGKFETSTQLASRKGGTLRLQSTPEELRMEADINRAVTYADDFMQNLESGNVFYSLTPRQSIPPVERVKIPYRDIPEPGNPSVKIRVFEETILHGFYIRRTGGLGKLQTRWEPWL